MENHIAGCNIAEDLNNMETFYRTSGAMTCEGLETLYGGKLDRNFRDTAFVSKLFSMTQGRQDAPGRISIIMLQ